MQKTNEVHFVNLNKLKRIIIKARQNSSDEIKYTCDPKLIFKKAMENDTLFKIKKDTFFCCFKTEFKNTSSIMMMFIKKSEGEFTSSNNIDLIYKIISSLEKLFIFIDKFEYGSMIDPSTDSSYIVLKAIKIINEFDIF